MSLPRPVPGPLKPGIGLLGQLNGGNGELAAADFCECSAPARAERALSVPDCQRILKLALEPADRQGVRFQDPATRTEEDPR